MEVTSSQLEHPYVCMCRRKKGEINMSVLNDTSYLGLDQILVYKHPFQKAVPVLKHMDQYLMPLICKGFDDMSLKVKPPRLMGY